MMYSFSSRKVRVWPDISIENIFDTHLFLVQCINYFYMYITKLFTIDSQTLITFAKSIKNA